MRCQISPQQVCVVLLYYGTRFAGQQSQLFFGWLQTPATLAAVLNKSRDFCQVDPKWKWKTNSWCKPTRSTSNYKTCPTCVAPSSMVGVRSWIRLWLGAVEITVWGYEWDSGSGKWKHQQVYRLRCTGGAAVFELGLMLQSNAVKPPQKRAQWNVAIKREPIKSNSGKK